MTVVQRALLFMIGFTLMYIMLHLAFVHALKGSAHAHGLYDAGCCSEDDCAPFKGTVEENDRGYQLSDGRFVAYGDKRIRMSFDKQFHTCQNSYNPLICLYVPGRGT